MKCHLQLLCFRDFQSQKQPKISLFFYLHSKSVGAAGSDQAGLYPEVASEMLVQSLGADSASDRCQPQDGLRAWGAASGSPVRASEEGQTRAGTDSLLPSGRLWAGPVPLPSHRPGGGGDECHGHEAGGLRTLGNHTDTHSCPVTSPPTSAVSSRDSKSRGAELSRVSLEQDSSRQLPTEDSLCWALGAVWFRPY